jgi:hypothetical protein
MKDKYSYPRLIFFTTTGSKEEDLTGKDETSRVDKRIAELGTDGWEMTGVVTEWGSGSGNQVSHTLYFKRPIE